MLRTGYSRPPRILRQAPATRVDSSLLKTEMELRSEDGSLFANVEMANNVYPVKVSKVLHFGLKIPLERFQFLFRLYNLPSALPLDDVPFIIKDDLSEKRKLAPIISGGSLRTPEKPNAATWIQTLLPAATLRYRPSALSRRWAIQRRRQANAHATCKRVINTRHLSPTRFDT